MNKIRFIQLLAMKKSFIGINLLLGLIPTWNFAQSSIETTSVQLNPTDNVWEESKIVSYNESFSYNLEEKVEWSIIKKIDGSIYKNGIGSIKDIKFNDPGFYTLLITESRINHSSECDHKHFPSKVEIEVKPTRLEFDLTTVKLEKQITIGQSQVGNYLTVEVNLYCLDGKEVEITQSELTTAGVGVNITGKLTKGSLILKPGKNILVFELSGSVSQSSYMMFGFYDLNGQVVPYYLPSKIN